MTGANAMLALAADTIRTRSNMARIYGFNGSMWELLFHRVFIRDVYAEVTKGEVRESSILTSLVLTPGGVISFEHPTTRINESTDRWYKASRDQSSVLLANTNTQSSDICTAALVQVCNSSNQKWSPQKSVYKVQQCKHEQVFIKLFRT